MLEIRNTASVWLGRLFTFFNVLISFFSGYKKHNKYMVKKNV